MSLFRTPRIKAPPEPTPEELKAKAKEAADKRRKSSDQFSQRQRTLGILQLQAPGIKT